MQTAPSVNSVACQAKRTENYPNHFSQRVSVKYMLLSKGLDFILVWIWVIGGKITFLPGAVVEGAEGLFDLPTAELLQAPIVPYISASEATTVAQLRDNFNQLLAVMKESGVMLDDLDEDATGEPPEDGAET